jgi:hypothetical protein
MNKNSQLKTFDRNEDGMGDCTEFAAFLLRFTKPCVLAHLSTNIVIFSVAIPNIVVMSRPGADHFLLWVQLCIMHPTCSILLQ